MTKTTILVLALASAVQADSLNEKLLDQAKRSAHAYWKLVQKQEAAESARAEKQRRALMAPWRLKELEAAEAAATAAAEDPAAPVTLVEDSNGRFVPRSWAMGNRAAPVAAAAPRAGGAPAVSVPGTTPSIAQGQAPSIAGSYLGGSFTAPSGAYQLPQTPSVAQPTSSYSQPIMPQTR